MNLRHHLRYIVIAIALTVGTSAFAHPGHLHPGEDEIDEFEQERALMTGLRHPFTTWEHWLPLLVTGCAAGVATQGRGRTLIAFAASMTLGGLVAFAGVALPGFSMIAVSVTFVSASVAIARGRAPTFLLALVAGVIGFSQGNAQFFKVPLQALLPAYGSGFIFASAALILVGMLAIRLVMRKPKLSSEASPALVS